MIGRFTLAFSQYQEFQFNISKGNNHCPFWRVCQNEVNWETRKRLRLFSIGQRANCESKSDFKLSWNTWSNSQFRQRSPQQFLGSQDYIVRETLTKIKIKIKKFLKNKEKMQGISMLFIQCKFSYSQLTGLWLCGRCPLWKDTHAKTRVVVAVCEIPGRLKQK